MLIICCDLTINDGSIIFLLLIDSGLVKICNEAETKKYLGSLNVGIKPNPLKLKGGGKILVSFEAEVIKAIPVGSEAKVDLTVDGSPMPCVDVGVMLVFKHL